MLNSCELGVFRFQFFLLLLLRLLLNKHSLIKKNSWAAWAVTWGLPQCRKQRPRYLSCCVVMLMVCRCQPNSLYECSRARSAHPPISVMLMVWRCQQSCMTCKTGSYCPAGGNSVWGTVCPNGYLSSLLPPRDQFSTSPSITCTPCSQVLSLPTVTGL